MHASSEFETFRRAVLEAVEQGDAPAVREAIYPQARVMSSEHGVAFRELLAGLPIETWHDDPRIAAAMGGSYRANGSPRGQAAIGYYRAAEDATALVPGTPQHCIAAVLIGHATAMRTHGLLVQSRAKLLSARIHIENTTAVPIRVGLGALWSLEHGILDLHEGLLDSARAHLEYAHGLATTHFTRAEHIECLGALALIDAINGELPRAIAHVGYARELGEGTELFQTGYGAPALIAESLVANERFDLDDAHLRDIAMLDAACRNEWEPVAYGISAQLQALQGRFVEALDTVHQSENGFRSWEVVGYGAQFAALLRAALLLGLDHADESWSILETLEPLEHHILCPARIIAQLRLQHGDLVGADEATRACLAEGESHCARTSVDIQLIRAAIELARGNTSAADVYAGRAFVAMGRTGARAPMQRVPGPMLNQLAERAAARPQSAEVTEMLAKVLEATAGQTSTVEPLSPRERLVLAQVQRGLTVAAIANELFISPNTVKTHLRRLYRKLGVSTREEAMRAARSLGLDREITLESPVSHRDSSEDAVI